jgi:hypothetical protein
MSIAQNACHAQFAPAVVGNQKPQALVNIGQPGGRCHCGLPTFGMFIEPRMSLACFAHGALPFSVSRHRLS